MTLRTFGRALAVLFVAYPLLAVSEESCGGAEQILCALETELARRGCRTSVAAAAGSRVSGELLATGLASAQTDDFSRRESEHVRAILDYLDRIRPLPDLIHDHSGSFWSHAGSLKVPVLATLHLPRSLYPADAFDTIPGNVTFNFVSDAQRREFSDLPQTAGVIRNGIVAEQFPMREEKEDYLLWMGRICPEKGTHLAIEAAQRCGAKLVIAGDVYPFSWHQQYFRRQVMPHLSDRRSRTFFLGPQRFAEKLRLLRRARALLVTSQCSETSSLVAMEAMACGTPVIGFRRGAIPDAVVNGKTGFVVDDAEQMAKAVSLLGQIHPRNCRHQIVEHFSLGRMADEYERLYARVTEPQQLIAAAAESLPIGAFSSSALLDPAA